MSEYRNVFSLSDIQNRRLFNLFERIATFPTDVDAYREAKELLRKPNINLQIVDGNDTYLLKQLLLPQPLPFNSPQIVFLYDEYHLTNLKDIIRIVVHKLDTNYLKNIVLPDLVWCDYFDNDNLAQFMIEEIEEKLGLSQPRKMEL